MPAIPAEPPRDEVARLAALRELHVLDTLPEQVYDDIVRLASQICGTPIGLVSLVDSERQWFKANLGLGVGQTHRDLAFCAHAIVSPEPVFVVEDAEQDPRFSDSALVTGDPHIRFYAGAPVVMPDGHAMGTVCVIDTVPRSLDAAQCRSLQALARQTAALLELRQRTLAAEREFDALERISAQAAQERRRSGELLEIVLRGGNIGLWDLAVPDGKFTVNEREHAMFGYSAGDAERLDWQSLIHPDDWPTLNAALVPHLKGETAFYECEHRMRHRDGQWIWVLVRAVVVERDPGGVPLRIVGTHVDVTERVYGRQALERALMLLQRMGALAEVGGWEFDLETGKVTWTDEVYKIHDLDPTTDLGLASNIDFYAPSARPIIRGAIENAIRDGTPWDLELPLVTAKGRALTVRTSGEAVMRGGKAHRLFGAFQDITQRKAAGQAALDSERRLRTIADNLPALIAHIDSEQRYRFLNAHVGRVFGVDPVQTLGRTMREVRGEATYAALAPHVAAVLGGQPSSFSYADRVGGQVHHYQSNYVPDVDAAGRVRGFYAMTFDITELQETQRQLEMLARVDALTGLANRRQFDERLADAMTTTRRTLQAMAVMFLDIDHFKSFNDSLGHAGGDAVLCEFARRLKACVRSTDTVVRLGGDEFVVLLEGIEGASELDRLAGKVVACIRPRFRVAGTLLDVTTSVGVAIYRGTEHTASDLLSQADAALYQAKTHGRDRYAVA